MKRENDELHLHSLPRERASDFFTARVMARVRETELEPGRRSGAAVATGIAGVILLALAVGFIVDARSPSEHPETTRVAATDRALMSAVESIEAGETQLEPVIYVGSTDHYDFYLDLRPSETTAAGVHTASYRGELQPGL
jgi:hypothetical protein